MRLIKLVRNDVMKQKSGFLWLFILVIPLGTTAAMFLDMYIRYDYLFTMAQKRGLTSWEMLVNENHTMLQWGIFLPIFVAIISAMVHQVEFDQNSWKSLLSLPVTRTSVFISKFITIVLFSSILIVLNAIGLVVVGKVIGFPEPLSIEYYGSYIIHQFVGIFGIAALHNWVSSIFKNQAIPVVLGFIGVILSSIILYQTFEIAKFSLYLYPFFAGGLQGFDSSVSIYGGIVCGAIITIIGNIEFTRRDIL